MKPPTVVLHYKSGAVRRVDTPDLATAETVAKHVNGGGSRFELHGVVYPCKTWVARATVESGLVLET